MRISNGFIIGAICGITAAVYMSKRRPGMFAWAGGRMMDNALSRKFGEQAQNKASANGGKAAGGSNKKMWQTIENLLETDPKAKKEAADVISASSH